MLFAAEEYIVVCGAIMLQCFQHGGQAIHISPSAALCRVAMFGGVTVYRSEWCSAAQSPRVGHGSIFDDPIQSNLDVRN